MPLVDYDPQAWEKHCQTQALYGCYARDGWVNYRIRNVGALWTAIAETGSDTVLDAGCFIGMYSQPLAITKVAYTGMDVTPKFVAEAAKLRPDLTFVLGDIRKMPFKDTEFDLVFSFGTLIHLDSIEEAIAELWRVAKSCMLLEATTHQFEADILEIPNEDPHFIHRAYRPDYVERILTEVTAAPLRARSNVLTYSSLMSTLWRVDRTQS